MNNNDSISELYQNFLDGNASADELQQLYLLFGTVNEQKLKALIAEEIEGDIIATKDEPGLLEALQVIHSRMDNTPVTSKKTTIRLWRWTSAVAAMLVIATGLILWQYMATDIKIITVAYGKTQQVRLPDNSTVWLNAGSTLQYPAHFSSKTRTVRLNGEAFFSVVHNVHIPFIVSTDKASIIVLGTSFDVSAFQSDHHLRVTVSTGKVGVRAGQKTIILLPGQRAVIDKITDNVKTIKVSTNAIAAWRQQRLLFDDQPLSEVIQALERKYDVQIEIQNKQLLSEHITMHLDNQPLSDVLNALSYSKHFKYSFAQKGKSVIVN